MRERRKLKVSIGFLAAAALFAPATGALAQHPLVAARLQQINAAAPPPSPDRIRAELAAVAARGGQANNACVPSEIVLAEITPITGATGIFQATLNGQLRNAWTAYATHRGCPGDPLVRYLIIERSDGNLAVAPVNEGRTYANPTIMRDASASAALAALQEARTIDAGCSGDDMAMGRTAVVGESDDLGPDVFGVRYVGSWTESWRFRTCGRDFDVRVEFRADGDGGAFFNISGDQVTVVEQER